MTISARNWSAVLALGAALALTGCTNPAPPPATSTSPAATSTPAPPTSTSPAADPQLAGAEAAVSTLWGLVDALGADPKRSLDELTTVARDQALETWRELLTSQRRQGLRQIGNILIVSSKASPSGGKFNVDTCIDVSKTSLVDQKGKSVVAANRPPRVRYASVVERGSDGKFYVVQDKVVGTC